MTEPVVVPSPRVPAPDVVRVVREIEEAKNPLALYWSPDSVRWQVLMHDCSPTRIAEGRKMSASIDSKMWNNLENLRRAWLMREGWSLVKEYTELDYTQPSWMRDDLQHLLGRSEMTILQEFAVGLDHSEGIPRQRRRLEVWQDFRETDGKLIAGVFVRGGAKPMSLPSFTRIASSVRNLVRKIA